MLIDELVAHAIRIDHQFDPAIASAAGAGGVRDDRMIRTMPDDEELIRTEPGFLGQVRKHRRRSSRREVVIA